jgi:hypothetical protein
MLCIRDEQLEKKVVTSGPPSREGEPTRAHLERRWAASFEVGS